MLSRYNPRKDENFKCFLQKVSDKERNKLSVALPVLGETLCGEVFFYFFLLCGEVLLPNFFYLCGEVAQTFFIRAFLSSSKAVKLDNWNCLEKSTASQLPLGPLKESRNLEMQFEPNAQVLSRSNKAAGLEEFRLDLMTLCFLER